MNDEYTDNEKNISLASIAISAINHRTKIKTPQAELHDLRTTSTSFASCIFNIEKNLIFDVKPSLLTIEDSEISNCFRKRARQLGQICNFQDEKIHEKEKMLKIAMLSDFLLACSNTLFVSKLGEEDYKCLYHAFRKNVIRITPPPPEEWFAPICLDFAANARVEELAWPHISLMYDLLTHFMTNRQFKGDYCKDYTLKILRKLPPLFNCPDSREREKLKTVFFLFYRYFPFHRTEVRSSISYCVQGNIDKGFIGLSDLLATFVPILNSLSTEKVEEIFLSSILPLHKISYIHHFFTELLKIVAIVVQANVRLVPVLFEYLVSIWPQTSPQKAVIFLNEIDGIFSIIENEEDFSVLKPLAMPVTHLMKRCVLDANVSVVERALVLWESDRIRELLLGNVMTVYPVIVPAVLSVASYHWSSDLQCLAGSVIALLKGSQPDYYAQSTQDILLGMGKRKGMVWHNFIGSAAGMPSEEKEKALRDLIRVFPECRVSTEFPSLSTILTSMSANQVSAAMKSFKNKTTPFKQKHKVQAVGSYKPKQGVPILPPVLKKQTMNILSPTSIKKPNLAPKMTRPK